MQLMGAGAAMDDVGRVEDDEGECGGRGWCVIRRA